MCILLEFYNLEIIAMSRILRPCRLLSCLSFRIWNWFKPLLSFKIAYTESKLEPPNKLQRLLVVFAHQRSEYDFICNFYRYIVEMTKSYICFLPKVQTPLIWQRRLTWSNIVSEGQVYGVACPPAQIKNLVQSVGCAWNGDPLPLGGQTNPLGPSPLPLSFLQPAFAGKSHWRISKLKCKPGGQVYGTATPSSQNW